MFKIYSDIKILGKQESINAVLNGEVQDLEYVLVADVDSNDPDEVYEFTQHVTSSWTENSKVTEIGTQRKRSTDVGDLFVNADATYVVADFGFTTI